MACFFDIGWGWVMCVWQMCEGSVVDSYPGFHTSRIEYP